MPDDKRMLFIKNMESPDLGSPESLTWEYQVLADAKFVGRMTYGPYELMLWDRGDEPEGEERWLCLRAKLKPLDTAAWQTASKSGFDHGGREVHELVALGSLFLRRRLSLGSLMRVNDVPMRPPSKRDWIDIQLVQGDSQLKDLEGWLRQVQTLDPKYHQRFILAAKLYQQALELMERKPDLAYLNLVSSIEALCFDYRTKGAVLAEWDAGFATLTSQIHPPDLRDKIEKRILEHGYVTRKFVRFICDHVEPSFWEADDRPQSGRVEPNQLEALMKRVYDQRSDALHAEEAFPVHVFNRPPEGEEIPTTEIISGERKWDTKDLVPYPFFFERLVNHVLKNFLTRNQIRNEQAQGQSG